MEDPEISKKQDAVVESYRKLYNHSSSCANITPNAQGEADVAFVLSRDLDTILAGSILLETARGVDVVDAALQIGTSADARIPGEVVEVDSKAYARFWDGPQEFPQTMATAGGLRLLLRLRVRDAMYHVVEQVTVLQATESKIGALISFIAAPKVTIKYDGYKYGEEHRDAVLNSYTRINLPKKAGFEFIQGNLPQKK